MKQTARGTALDALLQMEKSEGYSNLVIDKALKAAGLDRRDGALASTIFYGVLERRITLDYLIGQCLRDPRKKLDKTVRMALRTGAYQIFYLDRVPDSAAVNETVNALKVRGKTAYTGFANGVLRNLIRRKGELTLPAGDSALALSLRWSVPEGLIRLWQGSYGRETTLRLLESLGEKPGLFIRINTRKTTPETLKRALGEQDIDLELLDFPRGAGLLTGCGSPTALPQFLEGLFHVQDLSAQLVCEILSPQPGETVYDCCAAPGGKTFTLFENMEGTGSITAFDLHETRVKLIQAGAKRLGFSQITARAADFSKPVEGLPPADRVLCDVPCSGFGVIRRKPEIRYKDLSTLKELPRLQSAILENAARLVKPGGTLVYSTCTLNFGENGETAERFLRENKDFEPIPIALPGIRRCVDEPSHHFTMMPFAGASDGFFAAAFRKRLARREVEV